MTYRFCFELVGSVEIEADSEEEAWEEFDTLGDYGYYVNTTDALNVLVEESQ